MCVCLILEHHYNNDYFTAQTISIHPEHEARAAGEKLLNGLVLKSRWMHDVVMRNAYVTEISQ